MSRRPRKPGRPAAGQRPGQPPAPPPAAPAGSNPLAPDQRRKQLASHYRAKYRSR